MQDNLGALYLRQTVILPRSYSFADYKWSTMKAAGIAGCRGKLLSFKLVGWAVNWANLNVAALFSRRINFQGDIGTRHANAWLYTLQCQPRLSPDIGHRFDSGRHTTASG